MEIAKLEPSERIIVALDCSTLAQAETLVKQLAPTVGYFKVGSELFLAAGTKAVEMVQQHGGKVFLDLKFHDIPNTVAKAVEQATGFGVDMMTLHTAGGVSMMQAALEAAEKQAAQRGIGRPKLVAVTVLTSMTPQDLTAEGYHGNLQELVTTRARLAQQAGIDGVVCSPQETRLIKEYCGSAFLAVTPGIRPADRGDDQRRVATPRAALQDGSDYLVIGRPITAAADPAQAAQAIIASMN